MANRSYATGRSAFVEKQISWLNDNIAVVCVDQTYATAANTGVGGDQYLTAIAAGHRIGAPVSLTGKTESGGTMSAANVTFPALAGNPVYAYVIYQNTGVDATSQLIGIIDTASNLPFTPNGSDVVLQWNASGIWSI